jgi:hypothetical protein
MITSIRYWSSAPKKPPLPVGTKRFFKGTGYKKGWYELKHEYSSMYGCRVSNGRGGTRTEWIKMDPQPEPPIVTAVPIKT